MDSRPSRWRRAAARATDLFTVFFLLWAVYALLSIWWVPPLPPTVAFVGVLLAYEVGFLVAADGQTPGRDIWKVRVVTHDGAPLGAVQALRREFLPALCWLLPLPVAFVLAAALGASGVADIVGGTRTERKVDRELADG